MLILQEADSFSKWKKFQLYWWNKNLLCYVYMKTHRNELITTIIVNRYKKIIF